jgi:hypothetical protein
VSQYQKQYTNATIVLNPQETNTTNNSGVSVEVKGSPQQNLKKE